MNSLLRPILHKKNPLASCGLLVVNPSNTSCLGDLARIIKLKKRFLFNTQLYTGPEFFIAGPAVGAPMAALCLEALIAQGAKRVLLYSWCGSLRQELGAGDLFMPTLAVSEEGTSKHYPYEEEKRKKCLEEELYAWMCCQVPAIRLEPLWSTDAPMRETPEKIAAYARQGVWAVDMEYAALRAVAAFHDIELAALFTVSDELFHEKWRPAFTAQSFRRSSQERLQRLCAFFGEQH